VNLAYTTLLVSNRSNCSAIDPLEIILLRVNPELLFELLAIDGLGHA
jgi:hypothetical protein